MGHLVYSRSKLENRLGTFFRDIFPFHFSHDDRRQRGEIVVNFAIEDASDSPNLVFQLSEKMELIIMSSFVSDRAALKSVKG